jgi:hypothetical protein
VSTYHCAVCNHPVDSHPLNPSTYYCPACDRPWFPWHVTIEDVDGPACPYPHPERSGTPTKRAAMRKALSIFREHITERQSKGAFFVAPYYYVKEIDYAFKLMPILNNMRKVLDLLSGGQMPGPDYPESLVKAYCTVLVHRQRMHCEGLSPGSWTAMPDAIEVEDGGGDDFIYLPTYLAVAILSFTLMQLPHVSCQLDGLESSIKKGLDFLSGGRFSGHGYDWLSARLRALRIFEQGKVLELLSSRPDLSPEIVIALARVHGQTNQILEEHPTGDINHFTFAPCSRERYEWIAEITSPFSGKDLSLYGEQSR